PHSRDLTPTRGLPPTGLASAGLPALALSSPLTPTPLSERWHPMLEIPRSLARQFRAVLRRALAAQESRGAWPLVLCQADGHGLTLQARQGDVAIRYHLPGEGLPRRWPSGPRHSPSSRAALPTPYPLRASPLAGGAPAGKRGSNPGSWSWRPSPRTASRPSPTGPSSSPSCPPPS